MVSFNSHSIATYLVLPLDLLPSVCPLITPWHFSQLFFLSSPFLIQGCSSEISFGLAGPKNSFCLLCSQYILIQTPVSALAFYYNTLHIFVTKKLTFTTIHNTHNDVPISININKTMNSPVIRSVTGFHT